MCQARLIGWQSNSILLAGGFLSDDDYPGIGHHAECVVLMVVHQYTPRSDGAIDTILAIGSPHFEGAVRANLIKAVFWVWFDIEIVVDW